MKLSIRLFFIKDRDLFEAYNKIWVRISKLIENDEPAFNEKYLKSLHMHIKINMYFYGRKMAKEETYCTRL